MVSLNGEISNVLGTRIRLVITCLSLSVLLFVPLMIVSTGYIPLDDVLTSVARAISGRSWDDVVLLRHNVSLNLHSPGWDFLLRKTFLLTGASQSTMVAYAVTVMMFLFLMSGTATVVRVETWLAVLLAGFLVEPDFVVRISLGRPFILSSAVLVLLLALWTGKSVEGRMAVRCIVSILAVSLAAWIHGSWYLFVIPVAAFFIAGRFRDGLLLGLCCAAGALLAGVYTGHPIGFISHHLRHFGMVFGVLPTSMQVGELQSYKTALRVVPVIVAVSAWMVWRNKSWKILVDPVFIIVIAGLLLSFRVARFWLDWGMPALLVWLARLVDSEIQKAASKAVMRIPAVLGLGLVLVAVGMSDTNRRWTGNIRMFYGERADEVKWREGLPEGDGIVYSGSMHAFDLLFYRYPKEAWRYVVGSEPSIMPEEDLPVFIGIQKEGYNSKTIRPWVDRMRPNDRLIILASGQPDLPILEWRYVGTGLWAGQRKRILR